MEAASSFYCCVDEILVNNPISVLIGTPLWRCTRAADMACFQFGNRNKRTRDGKDFEVGDYALHVQCSWRIIRGDEIVVGREDLFEPEEAAHKAETYFDWQKANLQDARLKTLFVDGSRQFAVIGTALRAAGNLDILFDDEMRLEIFPGSSVRRQDLEHWRLFEPTADHNLSVNPHIIYSGLGLRYE